MLFKEENIWVKSRLHADISGWKLPMYDDSKHVECQKIIGNLLFWWNIGQETRQQSSSSLYRNIIVFSCYFLSKNDWFRKEPLIFVGDKAALDKLTLAVVHIFDGIRMGQNPEYIYATELNFILFKDVVSACLCKQ